MIIISNMNFNTVLVSRAVQGPVGMYIHGLGDSSWAEIMPPLVQRPLSPTATGTHLEGAAPYQF